MSAELPPVQFLGNQALTFGNLPIAIAKAATAIFPGVAGVAVGMIRAAGYNTASLFLTLADLPGGNTLTAKLVTIDPETGAALASSLGNLTLVAPTANGDYAVTTYLPTYYASLSGLVLPFYYLQLTLAHTGAAVGSLHINALKLWLSNA